MMERGSPKCGEEAYCPGLRIGKDEDLSQEMKNGLIVARGR